MDKKKEKKAKLSKKMLHRYRLVILNEDTFEERISFQVNRIKIILLVVFSAILLIGTTSVFIAFTPLREYIPGYSSTSLRLKATSLAYQVDSLEMKISQNDQYLNSIRTVLRGEDENTEIDTSAIFIKEKINPDSVDFDPSEAEVELREEVEQEDKYNLMEEAVFRSDFSLYPPVNGIITSNYDVPSKHYAVDIATSKDEPVKSTADGTVIFAEWSVETGFVIIIEHQFGLISVYKHNASLLTGQGDLVNAGQVIALAGNTGDLSSGTHLHFELWIDGNPIDPTEFISFE
jgi:murein DD-endopeptidase MepM/ murein hydrolase activator NlpD